MKLRASSGISLDHRSQVNGDDTEKGSLTGHKEAPLFLSKDSDLTNQCEDFPWSFLEALDRVPEEVLQ